MLPFQGKRPPQDAAAAVQFSAPLQHQHHHLEGIPQALQMMVPGQQGPAAYQAFAMPDKSALVDVQGSFVNSGRGSPDKFPYSHNRLFVHSS